MPPSQVALVSLMGVRVWTSRGWSQLCISLQGPSFVWFTSHWFAPQLLSNDVTTSFCGHLPTRWIPLNFASPQVLGTVICICGFIFMWSLSGDSCRILPAQSSFVSVPNTQNCCLWVDLPSYSLVLLNLFLDCEMQPQGCSALFVFSVKFYLLSTGVCKPYSQMPGFSFSSSAQNPLSSRHSFYPFLPWLAILLLLLKYFNDILPTYLSSLVLT